MIIACPECVGPFELRDGDIAELVQLECPHCRFRMILDFAAANDAALVESGMRMASGYRSTSDYRAATGGAPLRVAEQPTADAPEHVDDGLDERPTLIAAELPRIEPPQPDRSPPTAVPVEAPASRMPSVAASTPVATAPIGARLDPTPVLTPLGDDDDDVQETIVRQPLSRGGTVVGMAPTAPRAEAERPADVPTEPARRRSDVLAAAGEPRRPVEARTEEPAAPVRRIDAPPTTPAAEKPRPATPVAKPRPTPPPVVVDDIDDTPPARSGVFGTIVLVLLLLAAVGLTTLSVMRKGTPDPRPLLEDLYKQYVKP